MGVHIMPKMCDQNVIVFMVSKYHCLASTVIKVDYHANENPLRNSENIVYNGQRLMYPIINKKIPYHARFFKCH